MIAKLPDPHNRKEVMPMFSSFPVGRFAGTTVRVHFTFLLLLAWIFLDSYFADGFGTASGTLIFVVLVFGCVVAHEFGHVLVARHFGVTTPDITLYPFGGIARLNTLPQEPIREFLIAIAGPAVNIVIAAALVLLAGATLTLGEASGLANEQTGLASRLATTNVVLAVFNLIPAFPMDGGRLLRAGLASRVGFERATRLAVMVGYWFAFALAFVGLFTNPMLIVIAVFIFFAATAEKQATEVRSFSTGLPVARAMMTEFATLRPSASIDEAVECLLRTSQKMIPVTDEVGRIVGVLDIGVVIRALHQPEGPQPVVADIMAGDVPTLPQTAKLDDAYRLLQEKRAPAVAIVDADARLAGLVTLETFAEMLMLHEATASVFDRFHSHARTVPLAPRTSKGR